MKIIFKISIKFEKKIKKYTLIQGFKLIKFGYTSISIINAEYRRSKRKKPENFIIKRTRKLRKCCRKGLFGKRKEK